MFLNAKRLQQTFGLAIQCQMPRWRHLARGELLNLPTASPLLQSGINATLMRRKDSGMTAAQADEQAVEAKRQVLTQLSPPAAHSPSSPGQAVALRSLPDKPLGVRTYLAARARAGDHG